MEGMKNFIVSVIDKGDYKLDKIKEKIAKLFMLDHLTEEEMIEACRVACLDESKHLKQLIMLYGILEKLLLKMRLLNLILTTMELMNTSCTQVAEVKLHSA